MPVFLLLDSSSPIAVRLVIKGRVQGVFYGDCTVWDATELGLKGWIRNRIDGSLEHCFPGTLMQLKRWEQRRRRGPPSAVVTGLEVDNLACFLLCLATRSKSRFPPSLVRIFILFNWIFILCLPLQTLGLGNGHLLLIHLILHLRFILLQP